MVTFEKPGISAKVKITGATVIKGEHTPVGTIVTVDRILARQLIGSGKAVPAPTEPDKPATKEVKPTTKQRSRKSK